MAETYRPSLGQMGIDIRVEQYAGSFKDVTVRHPKGATDSQGKKIGGRWAPLAMSHARIAEEMHATAIEFQQRVVEYQEMNFKRARPGSGRLKKATLDPRNIRFSRLGYGVGDWDFLTGESVARYARTIEEGSAATWRKSNFLGLELRGAWGSVGGLVKQMNHKGRFNAVGGFGKEAPGTGFYRPNINYPLFLPKRHIEPMGAYKAVAEDQRTYRRASENARNLAQMAIQAAVTVGMAEVAGGPTTDDVLALAKELGVI